MASDPYSFGHTLDAHSFGHPLDPYSVGHAYNSSKRTDAIGHTISDGRGSVQSMDRKSKRCLFGRKCEHCRHFCRWLHDIFSCTAAASMLHHGHWTFFDGTWGSDHFHKSNSHGQVGFAIGIDAFGSATTVAALPSNFTDLAIYVWPTGHASQSRCRQCGSG